MLDLSGRPLLDNEADKALYVRRREHDLLVKSARQRLNVLLVGERGSGKTSVLRQVAYELRSTAAPAVLIDGKLALDTAGFLELVRYEIGRVAPALLPEGFELASREAPVPARPDASAATLLINLVDSLEPATKTAARIILLVDGLPSPEDGHTLFGRLRDELWRLPYSWVVAVDDRTRSALMQPPADAFFDRMVQLGGLSLRERRELIEKRTSKSRARGTHSLLTASEGNPRRLLALVRDAKEGGTAVDEVLASRVERERAASRLGRPASMLLTELEGLGAASASDEELLRRMGWTRGRASQVFSELEEAGLVTSELEKAASGRPRKVFQPAPSVVKR